MEQRQVTTALVTGAGRRLGADLGPVEIHRELMTAEATPVLIMEIAARSKNNNQIL